MKKHLKNRINITEIKATQLDTSKSYIFQIDVKDLPDEDILNQINFLQERLIKIGFNKDKILFMVTKNKKPTVKIKEVK